MKPLEKIRYIKNNYIKGIKIDQEKAKKRFNKIMKQCNAPQGIYNPTSLNWDFIWQVLMSERSATKTTNLLIWFVNLYTMYGQTFAYVRSDATAISRNAHKELFKIITDEQYGYIDAFTNGAFNNIEIVNGTPKKCYLIKVENGEVVARDDRYFCVLMSVDNSDSYTSVFNTTDTDYIFFDEFTRNYHKDDFLKFMNLLATIRRERESVRLVLASNTINPYHEYLKELCVSKTLVNMVKGDRAVITTELGATVYVEMLRVKIHDTKEFNATALEYYGFPNDSLKSLYGGTWEIKGFRHVPSGSDKTNDNPVYIEYLGNMFALETRTYKNQPIFMLRQKYKKIDNVTIFTDNVRFDEKIIYINYSQIIMFLLRIEKMGFLYFDTNETALTYTAIKESIKY